MSNKNYDQLNTLDKQLRQLYPPGMRQGIDVVIRKITGFELFNTRPYHNYETWSDGYEACDGTVYVKAEDLDDCIAKLMEAKQALAKGDLPTWRRPTESQRESFGLKEREK